MLLGIISGNLTVSVQITTNEADLELAPRLLWLLQQLQVINIVVQTNLHSALHGHCFVQFTIDFLLVGDYAG